MAHYTITIKTLIKNKFDFKMTSYPIWDENYRKTLNNKILYHYYEDEIAFETAPLFRIYLNQKMNEIMPYYNNLYKIQSKILDDNLALTNVNLHESRDLTKENNQTQSNDITSKQENKNIENETGTIDNNNKTTSNGTTTANSTTNNISNDNSKEIFQNTPQGKIHNTDINNANWATTATLNGNNHTGNETIENKGTDNSVVSAEGHQSQNRDLNNTLTLNGTENKLMNSSLNGTENYIKSITGANGKKYKIELLSDVKNNIMNIDTLIINDLSDLFMGIYL